MIYPFNSSTTTNANDVWVKWNNIYTRSRTIRVPDWTRTTTTAEETWRHWNEDWTNTNTTAYYTDTGITTASTETLIRVWEHWSEEVEQRSAHRRASVAQREQWRREEEERQRRYEEEQRRLLEAKNRAEALLKSCLTPQQREELESKNCFHLLVGTKKYRIKRGRSRNVQLINEQGVVVKTLCAHPSAMVPDADTMLMQKLMLEHAEEEFLRVANHS